MTLALRRAVFLDGERRPDDTKSAMTAGPSAASTARTAPAGSWTQTFMVQRCLRCLRLVQKLCAIARARSRRCRSNFRCGSERVSPRHEYWLWPSRWPRLLRLLLRPRLHLRRAPRRTKPASHCPDGWTVQHAVIRLRVAIRAGQVSRHWVEGFPRHVRHKEVNVWYEACSTQGTPWNISRLPN